MHRYRGRWRSVLDSLFLAPLVLPPTVLGFLLLLLMGKNGPLGALLLRLGINVVFTGYAAIISATVVAFPLMYKTVLGALEQIDGNLLQAARTLGASELRLVWWITLPLALPGILAGTTLAFARALGEFGATLMLAGNIPGKTQTLPMAIYFAVEAGAFQEAAAWTGVILGISLSGLVVVNSWNGKRRPASGQRLVERLMLGTGRRKESGFRPSLGWSRPFPLSLETLFAPLSPLSLPRLSAWRSQQLVFPHPNHQLQVTLTKRLPGFTLDVSFSTDHQPLGLLGASGAGKSLILRCIAGIETPDAGKIVLNGRVLFDSQRGINVPCSDRRVGILFQNYALFPHLTVAQNIAFGLPRPLSPQEQQQRVEAQLAVMQLQGMGDRYPAALSGGQQQRVAMARVLASQPEVLLLDEPFSALDTHLRSQLERDLGLWLDQFSGITLFVTHNIEEAYRICDHLLVMDQGRVSAHATKSAILEHPQNVSTARLTGCKNISRAVPLDRETIHALDWGCILKVSEPIPDHLTHIGIRAHQFGFLEALSPREVIVQNRTGEMGNWTDEPRSPQDTCPQSVQAEVERSPAPLPLLPNTFPCWLTLTSETPHRMTLYLKLKEPPTHPQDYHLQAEVFKEKWAVLQDMPFPWAIVLDPRRLMMLAYGPGSTTS